jgi:hypothetical protein
MNERGYYGPRREIRLAGVREWASTKLFERPVIADAIQTLARRAQQRAWNWLTEHGTPNAWLYTTTADISKDQIEAIDPDSARQRLHALMATGNVGFWAIMELGASAPKIVDVGVADAAASYLAGSPLVADQLAREHANTAVRGVPPNIGTAPSAETPWWKIAIGVGVVFGIGYALVSPTIKRVNKTVAGLAAEARSAGIRKGMSQAQQDRAWDAHYRKHGFPADLPMKHIPPEYRKPYHRP